jgi:transposase
MNTKLHTVADANGRPLNFFITAGQINEYTGAARHARRLTQSQVDAGRRGYDAEWFRDAVEQKGIKRCIPSRKSRSFSVKYDKRRKKDWRHVATCYDRCPSVFFRL